jgi:hypothetical protein
MARKLSNTKANIKRRRHNRAEYLKYQASPKRRKYRAELNAYARKKKIYGKRWSKGVDVMHVGGKISHVGSRKANRAAGARAGARKRRKK